MRGVLQAAGAAALGVLLAAATPRDQNETPVRVSVTAREGTGSTVCLQAAPGVRTRKRAHVSHAGGNAVLTVTPRAPGPDCVELASPEGTVTVDLQYTQLWVFPAALPTRTYPAERVRGKRLTFTWVRD